MQRSSAIFLLGLKEKFKLTQVSLQGVVQSITGLNLQHAANLKAQVCTSILNRFIVSLTFDTQVFSILDDSLTDLQRERMEVCFKQLEDPFVGLCTQYQQMQYYKNNFNFTVSEFLTYASVTCVS